MIKLINGRVPVERTPAPPAAAHVAPLRQLLDLLDRLAPRTYEATTPILPGGSVGAHVRHCLVFYDVLFSGLPQGRVDYNKRRRDLAIEADMGRARDSIRRTLDRLAGVSAREAAQPLLVRGEEADDSEDGEWCVSTLGRELQFVLSHTIHHQALIGVVLRAAGEEPDASFGVSPSTLRHWRRRAAS